MKYISDAMAGAGSLMAVSLHMLKLLTAMSALAYLLTCVVSLGFIDCLQLGAESINLDSRPKTFHTWVH